MTLEHQQEIMAMIEDKPREMAKRKLPLFGMCIYQLVKDFLHQQHGMELHANDSSKREPASNHLVWFGLIPFSSDYKLWFQKRVASRQHSACWACSNRLVGHLKYIDNALSADFTFNATTVSIPTSLSLPWLRRRN